MSTDAFAHAATHPGEKSRVAPLAVSTGVRALFGLMALANRVLVADGGDAGSIETHALVIERAGAYVGIALEARGVTDGASAAAVLAEVPVVQVSLPVLLPTVIRPAIQKGMNMLKTKVEGSA